jgi:selenocysteine lyase/cysteine desulfurase
VRDLVPHTVSWMAVKSAEDFTQLCNYDLNWFDNARRFEMITLPYQEFAGFNASLELFESVGWPDVHRLVAERADQIVNWARKRSDVTLVTPSDRACRAGVVAIRPRDPVAVSARLNAAHVPHSLREGMIRLAPHFYTSPDEIDRALHSLA